MSWTAYVLDASAPTGIVKRQVAYRAEPQNLFLGNGISSFPMAPFYLRIGGTLQEAIIDSAVSIVDTLCAEFADISVMPGRHVDFEDLYDAAVENLVSSRCKRQSSFRITPLAKLVTKVDFSFSLAPDRMEIIPIIIDINDLHGGLQWIDDFRDHYHTLSGDDLLAPTGKLIVARFVKEYVWSYINIHNRPPNNVLICLSDKARWDSDNGYSYKCIAAEFKRQLTAFGIVPRVGITYMEQYIDAVRYLERGSLVAKLIDDNGKPTDFTLGDIDLVVRNYRKIPFDGNLGRFTFSKELFPEPHKNYFSILEDERLRIVFDKRFVRSLADAERLPSCVIIPARIGTYDLGHPPEKLTATIANDANVKGISEIVIKLADKTVAKEATALFFNTNNQRHLEMVEKALRQIRENVQDVHHLVVDALVGDPIIDDRKIEVRTLVFAND